MAQRLLLVVALYGVMLLFQWKGAPPMRRREKVVYGTLLAFSLYEAADFVGKLNWMELYEWSDQVLTGPARAIERFLSAKSY